MRKLRTNILWLTAIFAIVGLVVQAWLAGETVIFSRARTDQGTIASPAAPVERASLAVGQTSDAPAGARIPTVYSPTQTALQLSDDASMLVAEMCDLQLMAQGTDLTLDSRQWAAFASAVLRFQAIRLNYEAQIASLAVVAPGRYRVDIPVYAEAGDLLRGQFSAELRAALGEPAAHAVIAKLGDRLEGCFAGFGVGVQTLDIAANPTADPSEVQITRTVRYWKSVEGGERLMTRREMHFPVLEDPTGDSWSPLLAMVRSADPESGPG